MPTGPTASRPGSPDPRATRRTPSEAFEGIDGALLFAALGVVILILLFTYRSPVLWILPIFSAVVALFCSQAVIYLLARYADLTVNGQSASILTVLVIGAGTDYALLLVARYREELRLHADRHEAMTEAVHRAGPAVLASGGTVVLGHAVPVRRGHELHRRPRARSRPSASRVTLVVLMTLLPALLVICGRWVFWPVRPTLGSREPSATGIWARVGAADQAAPAGGVGGHQRAAARREPRGAGPERHGPEPGRQLPRRPRVRSQGEEVARRALPRDRGQPGLRADHRRGRGRGGRRRGRHRRHRRGRAAADHRRLGADRGRRWPIPPTARPPTTPSSGCAPTWTTSATARRWSAATPRSTSTCRPPRSGTTA